MRVLIIYASIGGRAETIAKRISAQMSADGVSNDLYNVVQESADEIAIDAYDAVMLGSPAHNGHYDPRIEWCIRHYRQFLSEVPTAFFSVRDLSLGKHPGGDKEPPLTADIETRLYWQPSMKQTFSCAPRYSRFRLLNSRLMHWLTDAPTEETKCNDEPNASGTVDDFASRFTRFVHSCKQPLETRPAWSNAKREYSVLPTRK
ncbi:MAG: hypothetical protein KDB27_06455 [Planctomycetales bacterium]|nr:hypothetical protein [Planctomycetales bacterium]